MFGLISCQESNVPPALLKGTVESRDLADNSVGIRGVLGEPLGELMEIRFVRAPDTKDIKRPKFSFGKVLEVNGSKVEGSGTLIKIDFASYLDRPEVGATVVAKGYETGEFLGYTELASTELQKQVGIYAHWPGQYRFDPVFVILSIEKKAKLGKKATAAVEAKEVLKGLYDYASDNNGMFPPEIADLHPKYISDRNLLVDDKNKSRWGYFSGQANTAYSRSTLFWSRERLGGPYVVAQVGGDFLSVGEVDIQELEQKLLIKYKLN